MDFALLLSAQRGVRMKNLCKILITTIFLFVSFVYAKPSVSSEYIPSQIDKNIIDKNISNTKKQVIFYRLNGNKEFIPIIKVNDIVVGTLFPNNYTKAYICTKNIKIGVATRGDYVGYASDETIFLENSNLIFIKVIEYKDHKFTLEQVREDIAKDEIKNFNLKSNIINRYNPKCELNTTEHINQKEIVLKTFLSIFFETNSFDLTDDTKKELDKFVGWAKEYKNIDGIIIKSYADFRGSKQYNLILSQKRAKSVKDYMEIRDINIPLIVENMGETSYFSKNCNSLKGMALDVCLQENRRVNLNINIQKGVIDG